MFNLPRSAYWHAYSYLSVVSIIYLHVTNTYHEQRCVTSLWTAAKEHAPRVPRALQEKRTPWICSSVYHTHWLSYFSIEFGVSCLPWNFNDSIYCSWLFNLFPKFLKWRLKSFAFLRYRLRQSDLGWDDLVLLLHLATHFTIQRRTW